jgi:hypothetical protein
VKITDAHLNIMRRAITAPMHGECNHDRIGSRHDCPMRYRWDAMWDAVDAGRMPFPYEWNYTDAHIDTALRKLQSERGS